MQGFLWSVVCLKPLLAHISGNLLMNRVLLKVIPVRNTCSPATAGEESQGHCVGRCVHQHSPLPPHSPTYTDMAELMLVILF